jgi:hypothetical protein
LIRTVQLSAPFPVTGIVPFPTGNLAVSTDARPGRRGAYVRLIDPSGRDVRELLSVPPDGMGKQRPLLGHELNHVRLASGPGGTFAVWYPMDNYAIMFDSAGIESGRVVGCFPDHLAAAYRWQARNSHARQASVTLTGGIQVDGAGVIRMVSIHWENDEGWLRIRRYTASGEEVEARDFAVGAAGSFDRYLFLDGSLIAFNSRLRERGTKLIELDTP